MSHVKFLRAPPPLATQRTAIDSCLLADFGTVELSVTFTVKVNVPAAVGTPLKEPSSASVSPFGRAPSVTLQ